MRLTLAPGEVFEHTHQYDSTTTLLKGSVEVVVDGVRTALARGVATPIPARVPHTMVNVGRSVAVLECVHEQREPPTG
jgi:mannose-6-phosphate isomerase-like protein (cupin superfamily)